MRKADFIGRFEILERSCTVAMYGIGETNYVASCQVWRCGDRGFMHSINGRAVYQTLAQPGELTRLLKQLEVKSLEGYATPAHARLLKTALSEVGIVTALSHGMMAGRKMIWMRVEDK